jgi:asparagine synthase (glutamine-hydrolysing)
MAGLTGICSAQIATPVEAVKQAAQATVYAAHTSTRVIYERNHLILAKSSTGFLNEPWMQAESNGIFVWIDGEIYNHALLMDEKDDSFSKTIITHYKTDSLHRLFAGADGVFIVLIYDSVQQKLTLVTDRYGIKPFYLYAKNNTLIFAPELKCFPFFKEFDLKIRADVVNSFIDLEHFMGTATWFEQVELVEPATIYTYHVQQAKLSGEQYWTWAGVKFNRVALPEAAEELARLLTRAIKKRAYGDYRVGVALSGGFDSRAILATIRDQKPTTYTFGIAGSADVTIARKVAALAGVKNVHYEMHVTDWLQKRFSGVWKIDGMLNMVHMHYSHLMDEIPKIIDVNISGFVGDGVLGQNYIVKKGKKFLDTRITDSIARHYYGDYIRFSNPDNPYFNIAKTDPYLFYNRGRRLTGLGLEEAAKTIPQRVPFMDIDLLDFVYTLPDEYREGNKVYHYALMLLYPEFYKGIPHANTGMSINLNPGIIYQGRKKIHRLMYAVKYKLGIATNYTDVHNWIKEPKTAGFVRALLNPKTALYPNFTSSDFSQLYLEPHLAGKEKMLKRLMGAITIEIWLQQILNQKYLPDRQY